MRRISLLAGLLWFLLSTVVAHAAPIGDISFDTFIPGPGGVNSLSINHLTGDSLSSGFALLPDFPVLNSLTWMDRRLRLSAEVIDGSPEVFLLNTGDTGLIPVGVLEFWEFARFPLATLTARLNQTNLLLSDGSPFASGSFPTVGSDFAVIDVASAPGT